METYQFAECVPVGRSWSSGISEDENGALSPALYEKADDAIAEFNEEKQRYVEEAADPDDPRASDDKYEGAVFAALVDGDTLKLFGFDLRGYLAAKRKNKAADDQLFVGELFINVDWRSVHGV